MSGFLLSIFKDIAEKQRLQLEFKKEYKKIAFQSFEPQKRQKEHEEGSKQNS